MFVVCSLEHKVLKYEFARTVQCLPDANAKLQNENFYALEHS